MPKRNNKKSPPVPPASVAARREGKKAAVEPSPSAAESAAAHEGDCSICFDRLSRPSRLPCNHLFCLACIKQWAKVKNCCPLCKVRFLKVMELDGSTGRDLEERVIAQPPIPATAQIFPHVHLQRQPVTLVGSGFPFNFYLSLPPLQLQANPTGNPLNPS